MNDVASEINRIANELLKGDKNDKATAAFLFCIAGLHTIKRSYAYLDEAEAISRKELARINAINN